MEIAEHEGTQGREAETATAEPMPDVEATFEEIDVDAPLVGIIMGSKNDKPKMQPAGEALQQHGIRYEVRVMSAHRDPEQVREPCPASPRPTPTCRSWASRCPERTWEGWTHCSRRFRCRPACPSARSRSTAR